MEQKNSTHIRNVLGHLRYDTEKEIKIINDLYRNELRFYKNFFQPVMKLKEKIRDKGKIHRRYDTPRTPYQRIMESSYIPDTTKSRLRGLYLSLNPAELKRGIEKKLKKLYKVYHEKNNIVSSPKFSVNFLQDKEDISEEKMLNKFSSSLDVHLYERYENAFSPR